MQLEQIQQQLSGYHITYSEIRSDTVPLDAPVGPVTLRMTHLGLPGLIVFKVMIRIRRVPQRRLTGLQAQVWYVNLAQARVTGMITFGDNQSWTVEDLDPDHSITFTF